MPDDSAGQAQAAGEAVLMLLDAPMQSWGTDAGFTAERSTEPMPTLSGVTGLVANALGRPREERWRRQWGRAFDYLHMALPIAEVLDYRRRCTETLAARSVRVVEYAIWSRPEFFSMLVVPDDPDAADARDNLAAAVEEVLTLAQDLGGVMEYCHGVGIKLNHLLAREQGVGHEVTRALKRALDPAHIMNPGKLGL